MKYSLAAHSPNSQQTADTVMVQTALPDTGRIPAVDGLRGIAILSVMIFDFRSFGGSLGTALWEKLYANFADLGTVGVDLFFVISWFLITGILFDPRSRPSYYRTFFVRRTLRIFPIYYASLILFLVFAPPAFASNWQIFAWLYGLNWPIGLFGFSFAPPLLQHFWTLSVEEQFYLAWPKIVRTLDRKRLIFACATLIWISFAFRVTVCLWNLPIAASVWTVCRLDSLGIGAIVALSMRDDRDWAVLRKAAAKLALFATAGLILIIVWNGPPVSANIWMRTIGIDLRAILFGGLLVLLLDAPVGSVLQRAACSPFLRFFRKYSYGLYVCHQPLILILESYGCNFQALDDRLHNKVLAVLAVNAISLLLSIAIAWVSWHALEKHFLKLKELPALQLN